jgi:Type I restriction modification DNA specificity domain
MSDSIIAQADWLPLDALVKTGEIQLGRGNIISALDIAADEGSYPIYSSSAASTGEFGRYGKFMFDEELITWSVDGGGRPFHRKKHRFSVTNVGGFLRIKAHEKWDYRFVHALLQLQHSRMTFDWLMKAHPSVIRMLYKIPVVPLEEQRRIAEILDTIDETIQATERVIAKQQLLLESLRKSLFGGARRDCSLGTFAAKIQDGTHFSPTSQSGPYRYVTSKNIRMGYLDLSTSTFISESEHRAIFSRCDPRRGDVLLTKDGANTGNVAVSDLDEEVSLLSSVAMIRCDEHGSSGRFLYHFLASERGQQQMETAMSGNAITRLTLTKIRQLRIPVAAAHEQLETAAVLDAAESSILAEKRHRLTLLQTRDGLATDLLSGRVRTVAS